MMSLSPEQVQLEVQRRLKEMQKKMTDTQLVQQANKAGKEKLLPFNYTKIEGMDINTYRVEDLPIELKEWTFDLVKTNMKDIYIQGGWEWNDDKKKEELSTPTSRFLIVTKQDKPIAMIHFEFCLEDTNEQSDKIAAIYCLEIQIEKQETGKGLGAQLMKILEQIGMKYGMKKCMLTVLKNNLGATKFYKTNSYLLDDTDPSLHFPKHKLKKIPYTIMSKKLDE